MNPIGAARVRAVISMLVQGPPMNNRLTLAVAIGTAALAAMPAAAQDAAAPASAATTLPDPNDRGDTFTLGAGAAYIPDYEGSNDYRLIPAAALRGRVSGISFFTRASYLYVDVLRRPASGIDFDFGPIAGVRLNRTGKIKDDFVRRLPDRKTAIEVGGFAGVTLYGLTNPYDTLSLRVDVVKDVGKAHRSTIVTPTLEFGTPLSRKFYVGLSASADFVGNGYAEHYYSVTPAEALTSGLRPYNAGGGMKDWKLGLLANQSITGDLSHGLSLFGTGNYSRLVGDFKRAPIVADRGSATQWLGALGLAFTWK